MISDGQIQEDPGCRIARTYGGVHPPRAVKLAEANKARLTVLDVVSQVPRWGKTIEVGGRAVDIEALLLRDRNEQLRRLFQKTRGGSNTEVLLIPAIRSVTV